MTFVGSESQRNWGREAVSGRVAGRARARHPAKSKAVGQGGQGARGARGGQGVGAQGGHDRRVRVIALFSNTIYGL